MVAVVQDSLLLQAPMPETRQGPRYVASALVNVGLKAHHNLQHVVVVMETALPHAVWGVRGPLAPKMGLVQERKSGSVLLSSVSMVTQLEEAVHMFVADHLGLASLPRDH